MKSNFTSEFFAGNRKRLQELFTGTAPIVITANGLLQRGADSPFSFAQDANFWYLTGIDEPDITLVMDRDKEYLILPTRNVVQQAFDGALIEDDMIRRSGIKTLVDDKVGWEQLEDRLRKVKHVATIAAPAAYIDHYALFTNPARATLARRLKEAKPELELLDLAPHLSRMRMIKQAPELVTLQSAIDITIASFKEAARSSKLRGYAHEYELEAGITGGFRKRGATGHAFEPIVASGTRACTLHNVSNAGMLSTDDLIVVDIGAEVEHYAADITRTISVGGSPSRRQQNVYDAVLEVQNYALSLLQPGILMKDYEQQIERFMGEKLRELGLIKIIGHDEVRTFYPHATSHFLGLNVHDVGDYNRPLEPGVVLTVEPGIYIPAEGIGIRIEDDILITETGIKSLSNKLSRNLG